MKTMSGADEGLYGWIAANYILGNLMPQNALTLHQAKSTLHTLDMGGSSIEITGENILQDNTLGNGTSVVIAGDCLNFPWSKVLPHEGLRRNICSLWMYLASNYGSAI